MPKIAKKTIRNNIRYDLQQQLIKQKKHEKYWYDLVDDYLSLWDVKELYIKDIKKTGQWSKWSNGKQQGVKKNDAAVELIKINKRMTELLTVLSAEVESHVEDDDSDDDI